MMFISFVWGWRLYLNTQNLFEKALPKPGLNLNTQNLRNPFLHGYTINNIRRLADD